MRRRITGPLGAARRVACLGVLFIAAGFEGDALADDLASAGAEGGQATDAQDKRLDDRAFVPAEECGACHPGIYREWAGSWMARAFTHQRFQQNYRQMRTHDRLSGTNEADRCLGCHAPATAFAGDQRKRAQRAEEGVTCDACHRVVSVTPGASRFTAHYAGAGPRAGRRRAAGEAHAVERSQPFLDSSLCASCHHDQIATGIHLERTFEEWFYSGYRERGVGCVDCHMPSVPGPATQFDGFRSERSGHRSHRFFGGHADSPLLAGAARLQVLEQTERGSVRVVVQNIGAGHAIPTGGAHPNQLRLEMRFLDAEKRSLAARDRVFAFDYLNAEGRVAGPADPVRSVRDRTLGPESERSFHFSLPASPEIEVVPHFVLARLVYSPVVGPEAARVALSTDAEAFAPVVLHERELVLRLDSGSPAR